MGAALEDGRVNLPQAKVITKALDDLVTDPLPGEELPADLLAQAEAHLVDMAGVHDPGQLETLGRKILQVVAPETHDEHERLALERAHARADSATRLTLHRRGDGATDLRARIPDSVAARLRTMLDAWTSPKQDTGGGTGTDIGTGFAQRDPATGIRLPQERLRGRAFCAFLEAADPARMPVHGGAATRVVVTIDLKALRDGLGIGTLGIGDAATPIPVSEVRRLACTAGIVPAVLGSNSEVLDLGRVSRLFSPAQRVAKTVTHSVCGAEGCTLPSTWCEAHHARDPWAEGGNTDFADLEFLCSWHHHRAHDPGYVTDRLPNGDVRFTRRT